MKCTDVDELLADAWGHELTGDRLAEFDAHLRECESCRRQFEEGAKALEAMRSLSGPPAATAWREGDRPAFEFRVPSPGARPRRQASHLLRLAASVLIAFTAGYGLHAGLMMRDAATAASSEQIPGLIGQEPQQTAGGSHPNDADPIDSDNRETLRTALASAYARRGSRSHLATCLIAMSGPGR